MKINKKVFDKQGYLLIKNIIPSDTLATTRKLAINLKKDKINTFYNYAIDLSKFQLINV